MDIKGLNISDTESLVPDSRLLLAYTEYTIAISKVFLECKDAEEQKRLLYAAYLSAHATTLASMMGFQPVDVIPALEYALDLHKGSLQVTKDRQKGKPKPEGQSSSAVEPNINWGDS